MTDADAGARDGEERRRRRRGRRGGRREREEDGAIVGHAAEGLDGETDTAPAAEPVAHAVPATQVEPAHAAAPAAVAAVAAAGAVVVEVVAQAEPATPAAADAQPAPAHVEAAPAIAADDVQPVETVAAAPAVVAEAGPAPVEVSPTDALEVPQAAPVAEAPQAAPVVAAPATEVEAAPVAAAEPARVESVHVEPAPIEVVTAPVVERAQPAAAAPADVGDWIADTIASFERALDVLGARLDALDPADRASAETLLASRAAAVHALGKLVPRTLDAQCIRIHGDFHLGQVLDVQGDAFLIDFEGEPARPLERRRMKSHPLRDVAGLLRSLSYVSGIAQFTIDKAPLQAADRKRTLFDRFGQAAADRFVDCYRAATEQAPARFVDPRYEDRLLALFLIDKASYELCYEAANRPDWLSVPAGGLAGLVERLLDDGRAGGAS